MNSIAKVLATAAFALFAVGAQAEDLLYPGPFVKDPNAPVVMPDRSVDLNRLAPNLYQYDFAKPMMNQKIAGRSVAEVREEGRQQARAYLSAKPMIDLSRIGG